MAIVGCVFMAGVLLEGLHSIVDSGRRRRRRPWSMVDGDCVGFWMWTLGHRQQRTDHIQILIEAKMAGRFIIIWREEIFGLRAAGPPAFFAVSSRSRAEGQDQ